MAWKVGYNNDEDEGVRGWYVFAVDSEGKPLTGSYTEGPFSTQEIADTAAEVLDNTLIKRPAGYFNPPPPLTEAQIEDIRRGYKVTKPPKDTIPITAIGKEEPIGYVVKVGDRTIRLSGRTRGNTADDTISPEMQKAIDDARADMAARQKRVEAIEARHRSSNNMFNNDSSRAQYVIGQGRNSKYTLTMGDVYKIVHDRLNYARPEVKFDIDALCQNVCCEIEAKLGIYPNIPKPRADDGKNELGPWTGGTTPFGHK